jgi:hypothetical protein
MQRHPSNKIASISLVLQEKGNERADEEEKVPIAIIAIGSRGNF